jgi:hypothetical protein
MSRIRDIANLFSANTDAATDAEVTAAISAHNTSANGHVKRGNTASRPGSPTTGDVYANTETGYFEIYNGATYGWEQVGAIASTPTSVVATNQGSGRAYNNGQASVAFSAGTIAGRSYTVTPSPSTSPTTFSGSSSPVTVTGLQSSTQYTYTVTATNNFGTSSASSASSGVTATTVPQAPTIGTATDLITGTSASVTFTAGATGGSAITSYTVTSNPGNITASGATSPITVTGLTNGTSYTFTVTATNANGTSSASSASNSVTITDYTLPTSYEPIAVATVPAGGLSSITFGGIPQGYSNLQLRMMVRQTGGSSGYTMRLNNDTGSNYIRHYLLGASSSVVAAGYTGQTSLILSDSAVSSTGANVFGAAVCDIIDYSNSQKTKTIKTFGGFDNNGSGYIDFLSGMWNNTSAVTTITINPDAGNFAQYSSFELYGLKGE